MLTPVVNEIRRQLEPVEPDDFAGGLSLAADTRVAGRAASSHRGRRGLRARATRRSRTVVNRSQTSHGATLAT